MLNWAVRTWEWWDYTALQTHDSKLHPWLSEADHATLRSWRLPSMLNIFKWAGDKSLFLWTLKARAGLNPRFRADSFNHCARVPDPVTRYHSKHIQDISAIPTLSLQTFQVACLLSWDTSSDGYSTSVQQYSRKTAVTSWTLKSEQLARCLSLQGNARVSIEKNQVSAKTTAQFWFTYQFLSKARRRLHYLMTIFRRYPSLKPHILFYRNSLIRFSRYCGYLFNNGRKSAISNFIELELFRGISLPEAAHFIL